MIFDRLHLTAFHDSPCGSRELLTSIKRLGYTILGPVENIQRLGLECRCWGLRSITQQHLRDYVRENYLAERIVVAAAGPVDHGELVKSAEELFCFRAGDGQRPEARFWHVSRAFGRLFACFLGGFGCETCEEKPVFCGAELLYRSQEASFSRSF